MSRVRRTEASLPARGRAVATGFWLMKTEPDVYGIVDLERDGWTAWEGVRNYEARNLLRDAVRRGDRVLVYHSSTAPPGVAGLARVRRAGYPDPSAADPESPYFDRRTAAGTTVWTAVDLEFVARFPRFVALADLKANPRLSGMLVTLRGQRLSVEPVAPEHFEEVLRMGAYT